MRITKKAGRAGFRFPRPVFTIKLLHVKGRSIRRDPKERVLEKIFINAAHIS